MAQTSPPDPPEHPPSGSGPARRVYVERHGPEATHRLEDLVAEAKRGSPLAPVTVVGPSRYANIALRRALSREKGLVNVRFEVMYSLAEYLVGTKVAGLGGAPLLWPAELAAIRATSAEVDPNGPLGSVAQHSRLHRSLRGTFRELDRLTEPARQRLEGADALRSEILRWYRRYRQRVEGLYDREDVAREAARAVSAGKAELALRESGRVIFHLPHRLSPAERGLVEALHWSGRCDVVLGFVGEEGTDATVRGLAGNLWPDQTSDVGIRADDGPMSTITHILSAPDTHEEIRWVIRRILRDAERGIPFHRMAVLFRQAHPYAQLIAGQLEFAGVPAAGPKLRPLRDTPPGKLIALLQMAVAEDFSRDSVLRWVAEAPVRGKDASRPAYDELNMWEIISRQAGIVGGVDQWLERLAAFRQRTEGQIESSGDLEEITPAAQAGLRQVLASAGRLEDFITKLRDDATPPSRGGLSSYSEWAKTLLREYAHDVDHWPEEHRESLEAIEKRLDEIAVLSDRFSEAGPADFNLLLEEALGIESGILGRVGSGVFVGLLEAAQCMDFETVYLVGMAEGAFPPSVGDDAMLPDRLRGDLDGDQTLDRRTTREAYERRGYLAALAACCTAVLSYPRAEPSGQRAQYPSPWILEAARGLHGAPVSSAELARHSSQNWLTLVESAEHGLEYVQAVAAADEHDYDLAAVREWGAARRSLEDHYLAAHEPLARAIEMERARASRRFTQWDGRLSEIAPVSKRLSLPQRGELSPTSLERWATCPFRYFMGDVLRLAALEAPSEDLSITPAEKGLLVHRILERFITAVLSDGDMPGPDRSWSQPHWDLLNRIAEEEFRQSESHGVTGRLLLWRVAKEDIRDDLARFIEEDDRWRSEGWRPSAAEQRFGFAASDQMPAAVVDLPDGSALRFRGLIDRVDVSESGDQAAVIDYKTGGLLAYEDMKKDPLDRGRRLQLPVYSAAVRSSDSVPDDVRAHYWFVSERGRFEKRQVDLAGLEARFKEVVGTISTGIASGLFPANPGPRDRDTWKSCRICDFDRVCPSNRDRSWERKRQAPDLSEYDRLAGSSGD